MVVCPQCRGRGTVPGNDAGLAAGLTRPVKCPACKGRNEGHVRVGDLLSQGWPMEALEALVPDIALAVSNQLLTEEDD